MIPISQQIFRDVLLLCLLLLAVGLPLYAWIRQKLTAECWTRRGNVWTGPFGIADVAAAFAFILVFFFQAGRAPVNGETEAVLPGAGHILLGSLFFLGIAGLVCSALVWRGNHLAEVFGLERLGPGRVLVECVAWLLLALLLVWLVGGLWIERVTRLVPGESGEQVLVGLLRDSGDLGLRLAIVASAVLIQPVAEEILFRGYLHAVIKRYSDVLLASVVSAAVFAVAHMNLQALLPLFVLGLVFSAAYERSGSLWVPIGLHALFNAATVVYQTVGASA